MNWNRGTSLVAAVLVLLAGIAAALMAWPSGSGHGATARQAAAAPGETRPRGRAPRFEDEDDDAPAPAGAITGTVVDPSEAPIGGALVCAVLQEPAPQPRCGRSSARGVFELESLPPGRYRIHATAAGMRPGAFPDPWTSTLPAVAAGETISGVRIVLAGGGSAIRGHVEDLTGGGIEGALVSAEDGATHPRATTVSGEDGAFTLWVAPGTQILRALADGYAPARARAIAPEEGVELRLLPESAIEGIVVDGDGSPLAGVTVETRAVLDPFGPDKGSAPALRVDSGPDGRFSIAGLQPGLYAITGRTEHTYGAAAEAVSLGFAQTVTGVVVTMRASPVVRGEVVVADSDRPCPGGTVELSNDAGWLDWRGEIGPAGAVSVLVPAPGRYEVTVRCEGFSAAAPYPSITVADVDPPPQRWTVERGAGLEVQVVDDEQTPVPGAEVVASPSGVVAGSERPTFTAVSDAEGRAHVDGLDPGTYAVTALARGLAASAPAVTDVPGREVTIVLGRGGRVMGTVVDGDDAPAAGVRVQLRAGAPPGVWIHDETDALGRFELAAVPPGLTYVAAVDGGGIVVPSGDAGKELAGESITVEATGTTEVTLRIAGVDKTIEGDVVDHTGAPVTDALVVARRDLGNTGISLRAVHRLQTGKLVTVTDADGHFVLEDLAEGEYSVRALQRRTGGEAVASGVHTGSTVRLRVEALATVEGRVLMRNGHAPQVFWTMLERRGMKWRRTEMFTDGSGYFKLTGVAPGRYTLGAKATAGDASQVIELGAAEAMAGIEFVLDEYASVRGRAVDYDTGEPVPGFRAIMQDAKGGLFSPMWKNVSDASGVFEIAAAPSGRVTLHLVAADSRSQALQRGAHRTYDLEPGQMGDIGDVVLAKDPLEPGERRGERGYREAFWDHEADQLEQHIDVSKVVPGGPADRAGLRVGDRIVSVGDVDVTGNNTYLYYSLRNVGPGTPLVLGLATGKSVTIEPR